MVEALDAIGYEGFRIAEVPRGDAFRLKFFAERMDQVVKGGLLLLTAVQSEAFDVRVNVERGRA